MHFAPRAYSGGRRGGWRGVEGGGWPSPVQYMAEPKEIAAFKQTYSVCMYVCKICTYLSFSSPPRHPLLCLQIWPCFEDYFWVSPLYFCPWKCKTFARNTEKNNDWNSLKWVFCISINTCICICICTYTYIWNVFYTSFHIYFFSLEI